MDNKRRQKTQAKNVEDQKSATGTNKSTYKWPQQDAEKMAVVMQLVCW